MANDEYKQQKKLWNKGRRRAVRPFKGLAVLFPILAVICCVALAVVNMIPLTVSLLVDADWYTVNDEDEGAVYYESDFESDEERVEYGVQIAEQVTAEGSTLLVNKDDALPLAEGSKVTLFSHSSVDLQYGGTGSAALSLDEIETLKDGLEEVGIEVNETMWDFYESGDGSEYGIEERSMIDLFSGEETDFKANEVPLDVYSETEWDSVEEYGDAAIVVLSRTSGEDIDLTSGNEDSTDGGYLTLSDEEKDLLEKIAELKAEGVVQKTIVLINSANTFELDFITNDEYDIDAVLNVGYLGGEGVSAVCDILVGNVNPSGRLADTYLNDNTTSPAYVNYGSYSYTNADEAGLDEHSCYYVVYQEGIYVGYRYYETRYEDYVMGTGNAGDYDYDSDVAFAFGYGLSYTDFEYSGFTATYDETTDTYVVQVTVTNVGDVAGKETVEVYAQAPYTEYDQENDVEKSSVVLVGFDKTDELEPGESEDITITVEGSELASYDAYGAGTYILDAGDYYLTVAHDTHDAVNNILAAKGYSPESTDGRMDDEGDAGSVYSRTVEALDTTTYSVSDAGVSIENQFDDADLNQADYSDGQTITYLSRSDWEGTFPSEAVSLYASDAMVEELSQTRYDADTYDGLYAGSEMPTTGAENGLSLIDMLGLDYDDPAWDDLLDQLTAEEMAYILGYDFHYTQVSETIGLPMTRAENGPSGLTMSLFGQEVDVETMTLPSEDILGATWNTDLMAEVGSVIGADCLAAGVTYFYGPGVNIHRTAYSGRNFEYYSEDSFLSGQMLAAEVSAIEEQGVHVMVKHFAMNDQETNRDGVCTFANEQSIREIYLKAFQYALEENELSGVMTAFNRIGCHWCGSDEGLLYGVLRSEWGCNGVVTSDNSAMSFYYMDGVDGVLATADVFDATMQIEYDQLLEYVDDPVVVTAMRESVHRLAYATLNSAAMNGIGEESTLTEHNPWFITALQVAIAVTVVCSVVFIALAAVRSSRYRKANPKPRKKQFVGTSEPEGGAQAGE